MQISKGNGQTPHGPGIDIRITADEVATAIDSWLVSQGVQIQGPRTVRVNGELCNDGNVYVDPSGFVVIRGEAMQPKGAKS